MESSESGRRARDTRHDRAHDAGEQGQPSEAGTDDAGNQPGCRADQKAPINESLMVQKQEAESGEENHRDDGRSCPARSSVPVEGARAVHAPIGLPNAERIASTIWCG